MFKLILFSYDGDAYHYPELFKTGEDADWVACRLFNYETWTIIELT